MTHLVGRGALRGSFEMLVEVTPAFLAYQPARVLGVAGSPLHLRWNFAPVAGRTRIFAEASGGLLYTTGAVVYVRRSPDPRPQTFGYHEVFHALTFAAAGCHYAAIAFFVLSQA